MNKIQILTYGSLLSFSMTASSASIFFGEDLNPGSSTANSSAASAEFQSHLSGVGTEDFESFADGAGGPLAIDFGIAGTATLSGSGAIQTGPSVGRFPVSGSKYWETNEDFVIDFTTAISAFGFFGTDIGDFAGQITLDFLSGATTSYTVNNTVNAPDGSLLFWGIIDDANPFTRITFGNTNFSDFFGFDDMTIGVSSQIVDPTVPEPATLALFGFGLAGMFLSRKNKKA